MERREAEHNSEPERVASPPDANERAENLLMQEGQTKPEPQAQDERRYSAEEIKKRSRKNLIFGIVSIAIIACVISVLVQLSKTLQEGNSATFDQMLRAMNGWYLVLVAALFLVGFVLDSLKYTLLNASNGYRLGFHKDMRMALTGKYYENITPTATGGQPMQIYYLYRQGMPGANSASVTMVKYGVQMLAWTVFAAVVMGCLSGTLNNIEDTAMRTTVRVCAWVGFSINGMIPITVTFVVFFPRVVAWAANLGIRILHALHIVKDVAGKQEKVRKWMDDFAGFSQFIYKRPLRFLLLFALCMAEPIIQFTIPYFLLLALCGQYVTPGWELYLTVVGLAMYATDAAVFIPTPGNSGAIEAVFMLAFASIASNVLFWYVLIWRFVLYYSYIVMGMGMNVFDLVERFRKKRNKARKRE